jgi:hypothetical protein
MAPPATRASGAPSSYLAAAAAAPSAPAPSAEPTRKRARTPTAAEQRTNTGGGLGPLRSAALVMSNASDAGAAQRASARELAASIAAAQAEKEIDIIKARKAAKAAKAAAAAEKKRISGEARAASRAAAAALVPPAPTAQPQTAPAHDQAGPAAPPAAASADPAAAADPAGNPALTPGQHARVVLADTTVVGNAAHRFDALAEPGAPPRASEYDSDVIFAGHVPAAAAALPAATAGALAIIGALPAATDASSQPPPRRSAAGRAPLGVSGPRPGRPANSALARPASGAARRAPPFAPGAAPRGLAPSAALYPMMDGAALMGPSLPVRTPGLAPPLNIINYNPTQFATLSPLHPPTFSVGITFASPIIFRFQFIFFSAMLSSSAPFPRAPPGDALRRAAPLAYPLDRPPAPPTFPAQTPGFPPKGFPPCTPPPARTPG